MIYFVFPVYNEEKNIRSLILCLRKLMQGEDYKMIAVNDGSTDRSLEILEELNGPDLLIVGSAINMNIGAVFSLGIDEVLKNAKNDDILVIMESDQTSELSLVKLLAARIESGENDIIIASRYLKGGGYLNFPLPRRVFSCCANYFMHLLFPIKNVKDYTIFFRAYRIGIIRKVSDYFGKYGLIQSKGFVANAEFLIKLSLFTCRIEEIPFVYNYAKKIGKSKINVLRTINEYFVLTSYLKRICLKVKQSQACQNIKEAIK